MVGRLFQEDRILGKLLRQKKKKSKAQIKTNIRRSYPSSRKEVEDSICSPQHEIRNKVRVRSGVTEIIPCRQADDEPQDYRIGDFSSHAL